MTDKEKEQKKLERKATEFLRQHGDKKKHKRFTRRKKSRLNYEKINWVRQQKNKK